MNSGLRILGIGTVLIVWLIGCKALLPVTKIVNEDINNFKYFYMTPTTELTSSSGATISGQYYSSTKTINPADVITGRLTKTGFIRIPELKKEDLQEDTFIVNYGESGTRKTGFGGYAIEVTIQFISARTNSLVCSCTAEGRGSTEADDIRQAITRCLDELIEK